MIEFLNTTYVMALDASFWLVIGLFIGGLFKTLIPTAFLQKHLSHDGFGSIVKAAILGAPLPLCSCGVIPAAMGLRKAGASKSATTSFLVSTPETGVDSVFITYAMMGPFMAIVRPIIALTSAITAGTLVNFFDTDDEKIEDETTKNKTENNSSCCAKEEVTEPVQTSCCDSKSEEQKTINETEESCCSTDEKEISTLHKVWNGVSYAFTNLLDEIIFWLVIGLVFAAMVQTFVSNEFLLEYGTGWTGMLVMLVVGIPMYVCATASTPLAAGFLLAGISPGAVIVFLMAGPATNMATLGIITQQMGKRTMVLYLIGIMSIALSSGFLVNWLVSHWSIDIDQHLSMQHSHIPMWLQGLSLLLLLGLSLRKFFNGKGIKKLETI